MSTKKYKNRKVIIIAIIIVIVALIGTVGVIMFKDLFRTYETTDIEEYGKYEGVFYYEPVLLPEKIPSGAEVKQYKYVMKSGPLDESQYIILICKYESNTYDAEKKRMSEVKDEYSEVTYNTEQFEFPAYVYMFNDGDNSEYALVDDDTNTVYYLYIQNPFDFEDENMYLKN